MSAHLGRRVSDLLDGHLSAADTEAAWAHVHTCHVCRDDVEREGWVKTRLSSLSFDQGGDGAPDHLKGTLLGMPPGDCYLGAGGRAGVLGQPYAAGYPQHDVANRSRPRRMVGMAAIGGGAVGAAVMGVLALGTAPADAPTLDRRQQQPASQVTTPAPTPPRVPIKLPR